MNGELKAGIWSDFGGLISKQENRLREVELYIFAGNLTTYGHRHEVNNFFKWIQTVPSKYKIIVAGPNDKAFEEKPDWFLEMLIEFRNEHNNFYLENNHCIIDDILFYGSPHSTKCESLNSSYNSSFKLDDEEKLDDAWLKIPGDTDVLITSGSPYGIMDERVDVANLPYSEGCPYLRYTVQDLKPFCHIFNCRNNYGVEDHFGIKFIDACAMITYACPRINEPVYLTLKKKESNVYA